LSEWGLFLRENLENCRLRSKVRVKIFDVIAPAEQYLCRQLLFNGVSSFQRNAI